MSRGQKAAAPILALALIVVVMVIWMLVPRKQEPASAEVVAVAADTRAPRAMANPAPLQAPAQSVVQPSFAETAEPIEIAAPVVAAAVQPTAIQESVAGSAVVRVKVTEVGTLKAIPRVRVRLEKQQPESEGTPQRDRPWGFDWQSGPGGGGPGEAMMAFRGGGGPGSLAQLGDNPFEKFTDENGVALFEAVPADVYDITARYGQGPRVEDDVPLAVAQGRTHDASLEYPAPQPFKFRLLDIASQPVANESIEVGVAMFPGDVFTARSLSYTPVTTDAEGRFAILAYEGVRGASVRTTKAALFSSRPPREGAEQQRGDRGGPPDLGRGGGRWSANWTNPWFHIGDLRADQEVNVYMQTDVVVATAHLKNSPKARGEAGLIASVQGQSSTYPALPIVGDEFTFTATKGETVRITISQNGTQGVFGRESIEKTVTKTLPAEAGLYSFDIEFEPRRRVDGYVFHYDGRPASDIRVIANAFATTGAGATALEQESSTTNQRGRGPQRGGGGFMNNWRGAREIGQPSLVSDPTDTAGHFSFELPQLAEYLFGVDSASLPQESKGGDNIVKTWAELEKGDQVILRLKASSLIWGEVVDASGRPAPGVQVSLRGPDIPFNSPDFSTQTDETGMFELNIPPIRLTEPDPNEPLAHYVFAWHQGMGGGLGKAAIDDAETPVKIQLSPFASARIHVTQAGEPVTNIEFLQLYTIPGINVPISARSNGRRRSDDGIFEFPALLKGVSSISIWKSGEENPVPESVFIERNAPDRVERTVELGAAGG